MVIRSPHSTATSILANISMHETLPYLEPSNFPNIKRKNLEILQVNLGYLCNLSCVHCHVNAGPKRKELMQLSTIHQLLDFIDQAGIHTLDLTGGAPEMNPHFRFLVVAAKQRKIKVIDRCNLVILQEPGYEDLTAFLAEQHVEITASLPCYLEDNVDQQRGKGVFHDSIAAIKKLNQYGYGQKASNLVLNLVYNPQDATLPPPQQPLEQAYKSHLQEHYGVVFNNLYALANMPIQRFGSTLISKGQMQPYLQLLQDTHCAENLQSLMCLNSLSVDWQGYVYDCDFNQMLELPLGHSGNGAIHISQLQHQRLNNQQINVRQHCYGCTAGQGSSCGGAL